MSTDTPAGYIDLKRRYGHFTSSNAICPKCSHENSGSSNYCVNCGILLPGRNRKTVINLIEYDRLKRRPDISNSELSRLKAKANRSVWKHIRMKLKDLFRAFGDKLSDLWEEYIAIFFFFALCIAIGIAIAWLGGKCYNYFTAEPSIIVVKGENGYGLQWDDGGLVVLENKYDSIKEVSISSSIQPYRLFYKDSLMGIVSPKGEVLSECEYRDFKIGEQLIIFKHSDGFWDLMKPNGEVITYGHYDDISWLCEDGRIAAIVRYYINSRSPFTNKMSSLCSIVDGDGKYLLKDCIWIYNYSQGVAAVRRTSKNELEYVDMTGKTVLPQKYSVVSKEISYDNYSFWINDKGYGIDPSFINDTARVYVNGVKSYLFRDGKYIGVK